MQSPATPRLPSVIREHLRGMLFLLVLSPGLFVACSSVKAGVTFGTANSGTDISQTGSRFPLGSTHQLFYRVRTTSGFGTTSITVQVSQNTGGAAFKIVDSATKEVQADWNVVVAKFDPNAYGAGKYRISVTAKDKVVAQGDVEFN